MALLGENDGSKNEGRVLVKKVSRQLSEENRRQFFFAGIEFLGGFRRVHMINLFDLKLTYLQKFTKNCLLPQKIPAHATVSTPPC